MTSFAEIIMLLVKQLYLIFSNEIWKKKYKSFLSMYCLYDIVTLVVYDIVTLDVYRSLLLTRCEFFS